MRKLWLLLAAFFVVCLNASATTWYVRTDGGTRYDATYNPTGQCDGTADVSYASTGGTGTNKHCAFNDERYFWTAGGYTTGTVGSGGWGWVGAGGDTYLIHGSIADGVSYRVGWNNATSAQDAGGFYWGVPGTGGNNASGPPPPPSGTSSQHTRILGANYASCSAQSDRTQLHGGYGVSQVLDLRGASYVDVQCLDITDFAQCGYGNDNTHTCALPDDSAAYGVRFNNSSNHITLTNVRLHGLATEGIYGPPGDQVNLSYVDIVGNGGIGWNADDGSGTTGQGTDLIQNYSIIASGCIEEYPIVHTAWPYTDCTDQSDENLGTGDGFGTATVASATPWNVTFDEGVVAYNTQDGLDALHLIGAGSTMTITRTLAYGNMGQQIKVGGAGGAAYNNIIYTNCRAMASKDSFPGAVAPNTYSISGYSITVSGGVSYITANYTGSPAIQVNQYVMLQDFTGASASLAWLNHVHVKVTSVSSGSFTAKFVDGYAPTAQTSSDTGTGWVGWNSGLEMFCRAGDSGVVITTGHNAKVVFDDNTIFAAGHIAVELDCDTSNGSCDSTSLVDIRNNAILGFANTVANGYLSSNATGNPPSAIYKGVVDQGYPDPFANSGSLYSNNDFDGTGACTSGAATGYICTDPGLTDEAWHLYDYGNVTPSSSMSAVVAAGVTINTISGDYSGARRQSPPSIGALEYGSTMAHVVATVNSVVSHTLGALHSLGQTIFH